MAIDRRATRLGVLALVGVVLFSLLGVRLWFLQTVKAEELQESVTFAKTRTVPIAPERGRIFDADMRIVADNERVLTVAVDWQVLRRKSQRDEIFRRLSGWVQVPVEEMERRFDSNVYSPFLPMPIAEDVDEPTAIALLERIEDFPGVEILTEWRRVYPYAPHAAHVIGYMGAITEDQLDERLDEGYLRNERVGQFGIERELEQVLHGAWGYKKVEVDGANRPVRVIEEVPPVNGFDVQLTIDLDLQKYTEQLLETTLERRRTQLAPNPIVKKPDGSRQRMDLTKPPTVSYKAPAGSTVVMNYDTGAVVAMASYPTFDNRWFEAGLSGTKFREIFPETDDPDQSILVNRAVQGRYNLGSTFKLFTAYAALNSDLLSAGEYYNDRGTYTLSRAAVSDRAACESGLIRCEFKNAICSFNGRPCVYGSVNVEDALAVSSDAFFYRIGDQIMVQNDFQPVLQEQVRLFGFGADTGIELPFEFDGTVPDAALKERYAEIGVISEDEGRGYYVGDNVQLAIGQGLLSATPLHLATGYAAVANGGLVIQPSVVANIWQPGTPDGDPGFADPERGSVFSDESQPKLIRQIPMSSSIRTPLVRGLRRVVTGPGTNGRSTTAEELFTGYPSDAIQVAGKTGTAQGAGNYPWNDSSVFTGFAVDTATSEYLNDEENPYVVTAYLEKAGYGSQAAAPVVKCTFLALSGKNALDPVVPSDPLDLDAIVAAPSQSLRDTSCYIGRDGNAVTGQRQGAIE
ncbi:penicillin-binding transpeptidase domain-containing protein [Ilumatobacter sp.]|uniref:penicillin-binding transpeptidase domain-containing protein n=1 Tax=Ilumatobacter sp. TaxID=1967498 RepID=UPI003AF4B52E